MPVTRVGVCGPHRVVRMALAEALDGEPDVEIVAVKRTAENLAAAVASVAVDAIVVLALDTVGDALVAAVTERFPGARVVAVCSPGDRTVDESGVVRLDRSSAGAGDVASALRTAQADGAQVAVLSSPGSRVRATALTNLEIQILRLIGGGMTGTQIAARLGLTPNAVSRRKGRIYAKLGVASQAHAVTAAVKEGLVAAQSGQPTTP